MNPIFRILLGLIVMAIGVYVTVRSYKILEWFGSSQWAEQKLGPGGSHTFYKLMGVFIAFFGIFIATDIVSDIFSAFANIFV